MYRFYILMISLLFFNGCGSKTLNYSSTATILIKSPNMKFYDKGFIKYFDDHIDLEILSAGQSVLKLKVYNDEICKDSLRCISSKEFNELYLNKNYKDDFLMKLLSKNDKIIQHKDNDIFIKIIKD